MKCSGLELQAGWTCRPTESPVVSPSDLVSKWPHDGETFQVTQEFRFWCDHFNIFVKGLPCGDVRNSFLTQNHFFLYSHSSALESGLSSGLFGAFSSPIGMTRHNVSYDDLMDATMHSPPSDLSVNILWKDPVIPQHKFRNTAEVLFLLCSYYLIQIVLCETS